MILYHVTSRKNLGHILKHGLIPGRRKGFTRKVDVARPLKEGKYLYFVDTLEGVGDLLVALGGYEYRPREWVILEVDVPENYPYFLESEVDPNASGIFQEFLVSRIPVKPSSIRVLGGVTSGYTQTPGAWELSSSHLPRRYNLPEELVEKIRSGAESSIKEEAPHWGWFEEKESTDLEELRRIRETYGDWSEGFPGKKEVEEVGE